MKLVTTARQLRAALGMLKPIIEKYNTYPVLGCVLFDGRHLVGTNLDLIMRVEIAATEASGQAAIEYFALAGLAKLIPADDVVTIEAGDNASIAFGTSRYQLPCFDPAGFPDIKGWKGKTGHAIPAAELKRPIRDISLCVSTEETRYYLNGACFSRDHDGRPVLVATDGHRLAASPLNFDAPWLDGKIVPNQAVKIINRMPEQVRIEAIEGDEFILRFVWPGMVLVTKLIVGTYPDWKRVAPKPEPDFFSVTLRSADLSAAVNRLMVLTTARSSGAVTLAFNDDGAILRLASSDRGTGVERLTCSGVRTGGAGERAVSVNPRYILDMLRIFQAGDEISLTFKDGWSPITVGAPGIDIHAVQMPRRGDDAAALAALNEAFPQLVAAE